MALEDLYQAYLMSGFNPNLLAGMGGIPPQVLYGGMGVRTPMPPTRMLYPIGATRQPQMARKAPQAAAGAGGALPESPAIPGAQDPLAALQGSADPGVRAILESPELQALRAMTPQMQPPPDPAMAQPQGFWERFAQQTGGNPIPLPEMIPQGFGQGFASGLAHGLSQALLAPATQRLQQRQAGYESQVQGTNLANQQALAAQQEQRKAVTQALIESWGARMKAAGKVPASMVPVDPKAVEAAKAAGLDLTGVLDEQGRAPLPVAGYVNKTFGPKPTPAGGGAGGTLISPEQYGSLSEALYRGDIPPTGQGYGMRGAWGKIVAQTLQSHPDFNLTQRTRDWYAVQRTVASLNGPQQTRLRQAIGTAPQALDNLESLVNQFEQVAPQFAAMPINRLVNKAGREWGLLGPQAQDLAVRIATQVVDVQPELAQIVMAGGVPGERSLQMAQNMINIGYAPRLIRSSIGTTRQNLQYRLNAIQQTLPITAGGGSVGREAGGPGAGQQAAPQQQSAPPKLPPGWVQIVGPNGESRYGPAAKARNLPAGWKVVK